MQLAGAGENHSTEEDETANEKIILGVRRAGEDPRKLVPAVLAAFEVESALAQQLDAELAAIDYVL